MFAAAIVFFVQSHADLLVKHGFSRGGSKVALVYRIGDGPIQSSNPKLTDLEVPPCSTFKIPNAAIALELGVVKFDELVKWDGVERWQASWNRDMRLPEAMRLSNVGFFQTLAKRIGRKQYENYLAKLNYGNRKIGDKVDLFWLDGSLKISPRQQVELMSSLAAGQWPMKAAVIKQVRIAIDQGGGYFGKTGTYTGSGTAWWIGFIERPDKPTIAFAVLSRESQTMGPTVRDRATKVFHDLGWLR